MNSNNLTKKPLSKQNIFTHREVFDSAHSNIISHITELHDGNIASGSYDRTIKIWSTTTLKMIKEIMLQKESPTCLIEIPNDVIIASTTEGNIISWYIPNGKEIKNVKVSKMKLEKLLKMSNDTFLSCGYDKTIRLWKIKLTETINEHNYTALSYINEMSYENCYDCVSCLCKIKEGQFCSGTLKTVQFWDVNTYNSIKSLEAHNKAISSLCLLSKNRLATGAWDGIVKIWDLETMKCLGTINQDYSYKIFEMFEIDENTLVALIAKYVIVIDLNLYQCDTVFPLETFEEAALVCKNKKLVIVVSSHKLEMYYS